MRVHIHNLFLDGATLFKENMLYLTLCTNLIVFFFSMPKNKKLNKRQNWIWKENEMEKQKRKKKLEEINK